MCVVLILFCIQLKNKKTWVMLLWMTFCHDLDLAWHKNSLYNDFTVLNLLLQTRLLI